MMVVSGPHERQHALEVGDGHRVPAEPWSQQVHGALRRLEREPLAQPAAPGAEGRQRRHVLVDALAAVAVGAHEAHQHLHHNKDTTKTKVT